jgi:hypothetical protein
MKLLDILGTTAETFSLGSGEKKIELRSIDGVLYFRNFGTGWQKASSESIKESLKLRTWYSGILLSENEIFSHNNSIWCSILTFTSTLFNSDANNFIKVSDILNFLKIDVSKITLINLNPDTADSILIENENTNISFIRINLPDEDFLNAGRQILFINNSNINVRIYRKNQESGFFTVNSLSSLALVLTFGEYVWTSLSFGGSEGGGGNVIDVTINLSDYGQNNVINPFSVGDIVYYDQVKKYWDLAYSSNNNLDIIGIVTYRFSNKIGVCLFGQISFTNGLLDNSSNAIEEGRTYYLTDDPLNPGGFSSLQGSINKKLFIALSPSTIFFLNNNDEERFNEQKIYTLDNNSSVNLNEGYSYRLDGHIHDDLNLTTFSGYIYQSTPVEALIESSSDIVFDSDSPGGLCFFMDGNNLKMKNTLGSSKKIIIYRKKIK